jgi:APA family basic amino acid/polyamine antiporter
MQNLLKKIPALTATSIVVANMIGTGVFTSLGFQLRELTNYTTILTLWILGGILAISGALSYAELGTHIKKSGGEFSFLSELFHPFVGYMAGWISITVGFAAPVALSAIAVVEYFPYWNAHPTVFSVVLVAFITLVHSFNNTSSSIFQNLSTLLKAAIILLLIIIGLIKTPESSNLLTQVNYTSEVFSIGFAIALVYVSYSYSGWNAAVYITEEIKSPRKSLPIALIGGTLIVTVVYVLLQFVFLKHVPRAELVNQVDIGAIATQKMLGLTTGKIFSLAISLLLISGISAMIWVGSRVVATMAKQFSLWSFFRAKENAVPLKSLWFQFGITVFLLVSGTFEQILMYCGFLLTFSSMLSVIGLIKIRRAGGNANAFKSPLFPWFQVIYITFSGYMMVFIVLDKPFEALLGLCNLFIGAIFWYFDKKINTTPNHENLTL